MNKSSFSVAFALVAAAAFSPASSAQGTSLNLELPPVQSATAPHYLSQTTAVAQSVSSVVLAPIPDAQAPHSVRLVDTMLAQTGSVAGR